MDPPPRAPGPSAPSPGAASRSPETPPEPVSPEAGSPGAAPAHAPPPETRLAERAGLRRPVGLVLGAALFLLLLLLPAPSGLAEPAWRTAALGVLMAVWWLTEAIPIPATALLPLVLLPLLGVAPVTDAAAPYANPVIFLFLGGFLIAAGMQRWGLHRRIALTALARVGTRPAALVAGFMGATALLSMWVSNTATALMMLPIGVSVLELARGEAKSRPARGRLAAERRNLEIALMLGIAYGASLGGLATLIGTPPNAFLAGFMAETYGRQVGFAEWMLLGLPVTAVGLPLAFLVLTRLVYPVGREPLPGGREAIREGLARLGPLTGPERTVALVFLGVALLWVTRPLLERWVPGLSDAGIAMAAGLALFLVPAGRGGFRGGEYVLRWEDAEVLPWGVLILFGGGLSLAAAIEHTGLNGWMGQAAAGLAQGPALLFLIPVCIFVVFLTELTSNTATAAAFLPILAAVAVQAGWDPLLLAAPAALAASCAFMLPVATPPNAIVFASGRVTIPHMARAGVWLNLVMVAVITVAAMVLVPLVFGS